VLDLHYYIRVSVTCFIFLIVLYFILKWSKSLQKKRYSGEIKIIDRISIDNGVTLVLVNIRDKNLLLGTGNRDVKVLDIFKTD